MTTRARTGEDFRTPAGGGLATTPPQESWDDWVEQDPRALPEMKERHYSIVPTVCFNCESACGLLAYVDKETFEVRKLEGNPLHPASRGRNCPKGPATASQITNPDRILHPLKRIGARGEGKWEEVSWDEVLDDIASRVRKAIEEKRKDAVVYHVGRPGEDLYTERVLASWGMDAHNSHTNVCSAGSRTGYTFWMGMDRPNPNFENSKFVLLMSSHLEAGHYFNPHAQRIIESKLDGAKLCVIDPRLSNTASRSDMWLAPRPGTESALLLAMANVLLQEEMADLEFMRRWVNWEEMLGDAAYLESLRESGIIEQVPQGQDFEVFMALLKEIYSRYTPTIAEQETGVPADEIVAVAREIGAAGKAFASHIWRGAAAGHLGGWMITRCLFFLNVLTGSVGTKGGMLPNGWTKFVARPHSVPIPVDAWNEAIWPPEFPLANLEMSFLLPHILRERGKSLDVYFTRVYNPVWTNPDGVSWIEMLEGDAIGLHVAMTPVWCETAQWADYVLPMGLGPERHDLHSYETHASQWIGLRQPVARVAMEAQGRPVKDTRDANPGEVWEENEFWIDLSWRIDPDGALGIRRHFESPYRAGEKIAIDEYYRWIFENSVPGLPEEAASQGQDPMEYMRRHGAFEVTRDVFEQHERPIDEKALAEAEVDPATGFVWIQDPPPPVNMRPYTGPFKDGGGRTRLGLTIDGTPVLGFPTPSGKLELFSTTLRDWGWPEYAIPGYPLDAAQRERMPHVVSQVHPSRIDHERSEYALLPTFRLPNLIHSRTNGAKWLYEIAHANPVWLNPVDATRIGVGTGNLVKVETEIGSFVDRVWVTEGLLPGVVACSHHLGRWRRSENHGSDRWNSAVVDLAHNSSHWSMKQKDGMTSWRSTDPDSERLWWTEAGVHQNLTMPMQPDPISGQHCWHQKVRVTRPEPGEEYGDISVDSEKGRQAYRRWLEMCRPGPGPDGMRRPFWLLRPLKPQPNAFKATQ